MQSCFLVRMQVPSRAHILAVSPRLFSIRAVRGHPDPSLPRLLWGVLSSWTTIVQVYVYRGAIQHHGIVTHVPRADALSQLEPHERPSAVHVVHFDSACDGVETTTLELFLKVREKHIIDGKD